MHIKPASQELHESAPEVSEYVWGGHSSQHDSVVYPLMHALRACIQVEHKASEDKNSM